MLTTQSSNRGGKACKTRNELTLTVSARFLEDHFDPLADCSLSNAKQLRSFGDRISIEEQAAQSAFPG